MTIGLRLWTVFNLELISNLLCLSQEKFLNEQMDLFAPVLHMKGCISLLESGLLVIVKDFAP